jgi:hypothetical protein
MLVGVATLAVHSFEPGGLTTRLQPTHVTMFDDAATSAASI